MKDASILGNLRGMLVDEIHGLRETLKRRKMNIIENIMRIFQKDPAIF